MKGDDLGLRRELREGQDGAGIGGLVVLGHEFERLAEDTARLVDVGEGKFGAVEREAAGVRPGTGHGQHHADLDGGTVGRCRATRECCAGRGRGDPAEHAPSRQNPWSFPLALSPGSTAELPTDWISDTG